MMLYLVLAALLLSTVEGYPDKEDFSNELRPWTRKKVKELMKRDLFGDIITHTYTNDRQLHKEVLREIIEEELNVENVTLVLNFVNRQHEEFLYTGYMKVYQIIEKESLGDYVLFQLAYQVKKDMFRGQVLTLLSLFPLAVRSVVFSKTVCIKNRGYGEYLYAAADDLKFDAEHRNVFTWRPNNEAGKAGDWVFQHIQGNRFHIINSMYDERFIAANDTYNRDDKRRRVFTVVDERRDADVWALEMKGDDIFIYNVHYNEYLYTLAGNEHDDMRRYVLTWIPKGRENCDSTTYQCRWFISLC